MCNSKEGDDLQTKCQADELFRKLGTRNVPLTKEDLRKAKAALRGKITGSSDEGANRE